MEGRYPNGILFAMTNLESWEKEKEYNFWFNYHHIPDVTAPGIFRNAIRYRNIDVQPGQGKYFITYETFRDDVEAAWAEELKTIAKIREDGRIFPGVQVAVAGVFKRLGGEFRAANKPTRGFFAVLRDFTIPEREEEYNRWYYDEHIPEILDTGHFHTAYHYESINPAATRGKYLSIYETDNPDAVEAREGMRKGIAAAMADPSRRELLAGIGTVNSIAGTRIWPEV